MGNLSTRRGKYGQRKFKAFALLYEATLEGRWLSARQLCILTGLRYYSLGRALPNWTRWGYVSRRVNGEGVFIYQLLPYGAGWLWAAKAQLPNATLFERQLKQWQEEHDLAERSRLMSLSFVEFVKVVGYGGMSKN